MKFNIEPEIFNAFPDLNIGVIIWQGHNIGRQDEREKLLREQEEATRQKYAKIENISEIPEIQTWRQAHQAFGSNPRAATTRQSRRS